MRRTSKAGFIVASRDVNNNILIPRYYDPGISEHLESLEAFELPSIQSLTDNLELEHTHGDYVPKINYGSGPYPYIRTSDFSNWELRSSPKHGISKIVFDQYSTFQDVQPEDIFFVHEGTYLIGATAMVTPYDGPLLYQHHLAKFRVKKTSRIGSYYLLAALNSPLVQRQIRSKQFSADIIDSVVGRVGELIIPIPKSTHLQKTIAIKTKEAIDGRSELKVKISHSLLALEGALRLSKPDKEIETIFDWKPDPDSYVDRPTFLGSRARAKSFVYNQKKLRNDILIPKYYDPLVDNDLKTLSSSCNLLTISDLIESKFISITSGDEIGRLSYGTGKFPFVRTSDLATYELKTDAKQGVSRAVLDQYRSKQAVNAGDILLVRDGTYLVGSSSIVFEDDLPLLFCGGIYKISISNNVNFSTGLCYALLNMPIVRRQMRNKQFTRDVIDTLGHRFKEIVLPIPKNPKVWQTIGEFFFNACRDRVKLRTNMVGIYNSLFEIKKR